jgi:hypothetical protein
LDNRRLMSKGCGRRTNLRISLRKERLREIDRASEYRQKQMARFAIDTQSFEQQYEWHSAAESDPPKREEYYSYHAAASRRIRISDGPSLLDQGQVVFAPPASQSVAPGTSPKVSGIVQMGGRVFGGSGEAGTGSRVSAPD